MSITILNNLYGNASLPRIGTIGNPMAVSALSDSYEGVEEVKGELVIEIGSLTVGDILKLDWKDTTIEFLVKASPNDSGYELSTTFSELKDLFNHNMLIFKFYNITADAVADTLTFTQKVADPNSQIAFNSSIVTNSGTLTEVSFTEAIEFEYRENYRTIMDAYDSNGVHLGSVQSILGANYSLVHYQAIFEGHFIRDLYDFALVTPFVPTGIFIKYYLMMFEEWGAPALPYNAVRPGAPNDLQIALDGKIDFFDFIGWDSRDYYRENSGAHTIVKFLTSQPKGRVLHKDQMAYLHICLNHSFDMRVAFIMNYQDGTSSTKQYLTTFSAASEVDLYAVPCGYEALDIESLAGGTVVSYDVVMESHENGDWVEFSEVFNFKVEERSYPDKFSFFFKTSYGVNETAMFVQDMVRESEQTSEEHMGVVEHGYSKGNFGNHSLKKRTSMRFYSGNSITKEEKKYLKELTGSKWIFFKDEDGIWKKLSLIDSFKFTDSTKDGMWNFEFEAKLANYD